MSTAASPEHVRLVVDEDNISEGAVKILDTIRPKWNTDHVRFKIFAGGYSNKLVGCFNSDYPTDVILIRVYGPCTDLLIDRKAETRNIRLLHQYGYAPRLYATFSNGLAYEYMPGDILSVDTVKSPAVFPLIAGLLARIHRVDCGPAVPRKPCLWDKLQQFMDLVPASYDDPDKQHRFTTLIPTKEHIQQELSLLKSRLSGLDSPVVFCHNDLLLANVIYDDTTRSIKFIDYEYANYNYQAYDIGNHFAEHAGMAVVDFSNYPSKEFQLKFLRAYLESYKEGDDDVTDVVTEEELLNLYVQVNQFSLATHFFWGVWALVQAQLSEIDFDYIEFSSIRIKEYFLKKDQFLSLKIA